LPPNTLESCRRAGAARRPAGQVGQAHPYEEREGRCMTDVHSPDEAQLEVAMAAEAVTPDTENSSGLRVSRRGALVGGALGFAAVLGISELDPELALATTLGAATTALIPVPTSGTAPEQLRLRVGADPTTEVTISWSAPGTAAMPAPTLAYSRSPISERNAGTI